MILARNTAIHASLWHTLHYHPDVIGRLTLWQVVNLAGHARDAQGSIKFPEGQEQLIGMDKDVSIEQKLSTLGMLAKVLGMPDAEMARVEAQLRAREQAEQEKTS